MFGQIEVMTAFERNTIAEFFYYVKYGSSKARHQRQVARESAPLLSQMTRHNVMEVCHQEETFEIGERIGLF